MDGGIDTQHDFAGIRFLRRPAQFLARFQVVIDSFHEGGAQITDALAVKSDDIADAGNVTNERFVFVAVFDAGRVALVGHQVHRAFRFLGLRPSWSTRQGIHPYRSPCGLSLVRVRLADILASP